ncbi:MAG TPA: hypothetical protein VGM89_01320 [Puia sp.]|jgi:hypothetical protein
MKPLLLILAFFGAGSGVIHAQTVPTLVEQLAALNSLLQTTEKGYQAAGNGLKTIGDIANGEFLLHTGYFDSLSVVKPVIADDPKVAAIRSLQALLVQQINADLMNLKK